MAEVGTIQTESAEIIDDRRGAPADASDPGKGQASGVSIPCGRHDQKEIFMIPRDQNSVYEELGRLNNELVTMQRETLQKNTEMSRLAAIVESSEEAISSTDLEGIFLSWNAAAERLYGYTKSEVLGRHISILPLPLPGQTDLVGFVVGRLQRGELAEPIEVVHTLKDGSQRDVSLTLSPLRDDQGNISGIISIAHDITERKQAEETMLRSLSLLQAQQAAALDGILVVDENRRIISVNGRLRAMWNIPAEITESGDDLRLLNYVSSLLKDPKLFVERVLYLYEHPTEHSHEEIEMKDGRIFDRDSGPIISEEGKHYGRIWFFRDITARKHAEASLQNANAALEEANHRLQALATQDGLTGLSNHRTFHERLESDVRQATRSRQPLALILLDVDHFKQYNDTYGHPEGDAVLKQVATLLQSAVRDTDLAARYGGEEFALILTQAKPGDALRVAERIRVAIASAPWERRAVTVSIGVAFLSKDVADAATLIASADRALYRSKTEGKNRVSCGGDATAPPAMLVLT